MTKPNCICFDLDGTLCNVSHRRQYVATKPRNWDAWNAGIINDKPNLPVLEVFNALKDRFPIFFVSGRSDDYRDVTVEWFEKHGIFESDYNCLLMRKCGDHRDDAIVKGEIADEIENNYKIFAVFDDRKKVNEEWLRRRYFVFDVSQGKGDF
jgi:phosphoglycolate phosphatase-like HAD superfamily hydrolase